MYVAELFTMAQCTTFRNQFATRYRHISRIWWEEFTGAHFNVGIPTMIIVMVFSNHKIITRFDCVCQ